VSHATASNMDQCAALLWRNRGPFSTVEQDKSASRIVCNSIRREMRVLIDGVIFPNLLCSREFQLSRSAPTVSPLLDYWSSSFNSPCTSATALRTCGENPQSQSCKVSHSAIHRKKEKTGLRLLRDTSLGVYEAARCVEIGRQGLDSKIASLR
jgi:hypothetical protein